MILSGPARLEAEIATALADLDGVRAVVLFGSALGSPNPRDVDILVVYGAPLSAADAHLVEPRVRDAVARVFKAPVHLLLFSEREARQPGLLKGFEPYRPLLGQLPD